MKEEQPEIKLVELNNKSRKGTYIYVRSKGKPSRYYKYKGIPIDIYQEHYIDKYISKKGKLEIRRREKRFYEQTYKTSKGLKKQAKGYVKEISKTPTINQTIKKGITEVTITNIHTANERTIKRKLMTLLKDLVLDKKLLAMLIKPENIKKIKHRFEYIAEIKNTDNNTIAKLKKFNITPDQALKELKETTKTGEELGNETYTTGTQNKLEKVGWNQENLQKKYMNDTIKKIDMKIIFRKGK